MSPVKKPTFQEERALLEQGIRLVAGVDEVGCGCLAGPVYAAAVILPLDSRIGLIRDSKTLSILQRERIIDEVKDKATAWAVGRATWQEVDALNIRGAGALAMRRAVEGLGVTPEFVLTDAFRIPGVTIPQKNVIRGDLNVKSIAAASIIAKVDRDKEMALLDRKYPGYGFAKHKGYATKVHKEALVRLGPSPVHRTSYAPIKALLH